MGAFIGYFAFAQIFQEQFQQQDRLALSNFESATIILTGVVQEVNKDTVVIEREGIRFPIQVNEETGIFTNKATLEELKAARQAGLLPQEKTIQDFAIGQVARVVATFSQDIFQAIDITIVSP